MHWILSSGAKKLKLPNIAISGQKSRIFEKFNLLKTILRYLKVVEWYQNVFISFSFCP